MQLNKPKFFILTIIGISIGLILSYYSQTHAVTYFLNLIFKSKQKSTCQIFCDIGNGYNESHSVRKSFGGNQTGKLALDLPAKKILSLRFDPLECIGSFEIRSISILGKKKVGNQHKVLHEFDLKFLKAVQQVDLVMNDAGNVVATTHNDCNDPVIELTLKEPFDHWQMSDFLGIEWLKKSAFFSFLITPIALAFSFSENKRRDITEKVSFKFDKQNHSLEWGDTFTSEPENCYQDTKEENIRSIIEEIENGTPWKQAVREKFEANNPWLYDIITSSKRTKFLDKVIKPTDLKILDIGAGWGQFTIPLAKQNKICSLEPTPERLDFIRAKSEQSRVSKNISFIGADYLDIKFENKFDLILSIGVLEWVGKFTNSTKPPETVQFEFLKKAKQELSEVGKCVIGIENRIGLKYLLGTNDDHIGIPDIACHTKDLAKEKYKQSTDNELRCLTYSLAEYEKLLKNAGYQKIQFYVSLPDYKLPDKIFSIKENKCKMNDFILSGGWIDEHDGTNGLTLKNQKELNSLYLSLAEMGLAHYFAPSFFIEAS